MSDNRRLIPMSVKHLDGDNWIIILMIAVAVITDIALIYYFINSRINIIKSRIGKNKNNSKQGELDELIHDFNELEINNDFKNEESDNAKEFIENIIENETELNEDKSNETIEEVKRFLKFDVLYDVLEV